MSRKAHYSHSIETLAGVKFIVIEDKMGPVSVTNVIEDVIASIEAADGLQDGEFLKVYKDSDGHWDGFNTSNNQFVHLGESTHQKAMKKYLDILDEDTQQRKHHKNYRLESKFN
jgi:hypothetical protein